MDVTVSKSEWKDNKYWIKKNPSGRLIALLFPQSKHIALTRSSNPNEYFTSGYQIEYPDYMQNTISIPSFVSEEDVILNLEWV